MSTKFLTIKTEDLILLHNFNWMSFQINIMILIDKKYRFKNSLIRFNSLKLNRVKSNDYLGLKLFYKLLLLKNIYKCFK